MYWFNDETEVKKMLKDLFTFFSIGALSAVINISCFALLWEWQRWPYTEAVSIAYLLSVIMHFMANRQFTFKAHAQDLSEQLMRYMVMIIVNYLTTLAISHFITHVIGLSPYFGVIAAIGFTGALSFFLAKFWVFKCAV